MLPYPLQEITTIPPIYNVHRFLTLLHGCFQIVLNQFMVSRTIYIVTIGLLPIGDYNQSGNSCFATTRQGSHVDGQYNTFFFAAAKNAFVFNHQHGRRDVTCKLIIMQPNISCYLVRSFSFTISLPDSVFSRTRRLKMANVNALYIIVVG